MHNKERDMLVKLIIPAVLLVAVFQGAWGDVVFFHSGQSIDGKLIEPFEGSDTVIVKTQYGELQYARSSVLTVLDDYDAHRVKPRLLAGIQYLSKGKIKEANSEFELVLRVNREFAPKVAELIKRYYLQRVEQFNKAFKKDTSPSVEMAQKLIQEGKLLIKAAGFQSSYKSNISEFGSSLTSIASYNQAQGQRMLAKGQAMLAAAQAAATPPPVTPTVDGAPPESPPPEEPPEEEKEEKKKLPMRLILFGGGVALLVVVLLVKKLQK